MSEIFTAENAASQAEFEIKFTTDAAGHKRLLQLERFRGLAPSRARALTSHYFDTEDGRLLAAGMSLRLRTPARGPCVMTFKAPAQGEGSFLERVEIEAVAPDRTFDLLAFDEKTRGLIAKATSDSPLAERYSTAFKRRVLSVQTERSVIEVALDVGHFAAGDRRAPLCEVEFELKSGERADAIALAREIALETSLQLETVSKAQRCALLAGLTLPRSFASPGAVVRDGLSLDAAIVLILSDCLRHFTSHIRPFRDAKTPQSVHQMRVALRRMRALLKTFARAAPEASFRAFADRARDIAKRLGPARDCDAFRQLAFGDALAHPRRPADSARLSAALDAEREQAYAVAAEMVDSPMVLTFVLDLQGYISRRGWRGEALDAHFALFPAPAGPFAQEALDALLRKARKKGHKLLSRTDEERHELRIALKSLRYNADVFAGLFGGPKQSRGYFAHLARLQELLGAFNDLAGAETMMDRLAQRGEDFPHAAGFVLGWHACEGEQADRKIARAWKNLKRADPFWA